MSLQIDIQDKNVFCADCKYFRYWATDIAEHTQCIHPHWVERTALHPIFRAEQILHRYAYAPLSYNKNCACTLYKRKWWKFWR